MGDVKFAAPSRKRHSFEKIGVADLLAYGNFKYSLNKIVSKAELACFRAVFVKRAGIRQIRH